MMKPTEFLRGTALAVVLGAPLALTPALAQDAATGGGEQPMNAQQQQPAGEGQTTAEQEQPAATGEAGDQQGTANAQDQQTPNPDALIATVGDAEIRGSDVMTAIGALPPRLRTQQPDLLVPLAVEQLVLRELILDRARQENLAEDPDVRQLVDEAAQLAEEDAMVQVWLQRELDERVTDQAVEQSYAQAQATTQQELPPLDEVRPQIEQTLRQQAIAEISNELRQGAEVTFYDASGSPVVMPPVAETGAVGSGAATPGADGDRIDDMGGDMQQAPQ